MVNVDDYRAGAKKEKEEKSVVVFFPGLFNSPLLEGSTERKLGTSSIPATRL